MSYLSVFVSIKIHISCVVINYINSGNTSFDLIPQTFNQIHNLEVLLLYIEIILKIILNFCIPILIMCHGWTFHKYLIITFYWDVYTSHLKTLYSSIANTFYFWKIKFLFFRPWGIFISRSSCLPVLLTGCPGF
jgi:hypothetical protein